MSTTKDLYANFQGLTSDATTGLGAKALVNMTAHDEVHVRTGDRPGGWSEAGTKALEFCAETKMPDGTELRVHAYLKRHGERVSISWHVAASRDDDEETFLDPSKCTTSVSARESGLLIDADEAAVKSAFERVSRRAATRCVARVAAAWGVETT